MIIAQAQASSLTLTPLVSPGECNWVSLHVAAHLADLGAQMTIPLTYDETDIEMGDVDAKHGYESESEPETVRLWKTDSATHLTSSRPTTLKVQASRRSV